MEKDLLNYAWKRKRGTKREKDPLVANTKPQETRVISRVS